MATEISLLFYICFPLSTTSTSKPWPIPPSSFWLVYCLQHWAHWLLQRKKSLKASHKLIAKGSVISWKATHCGLIKEGEDSGEYGVSWKRARCVFDCFLVCRVTGKQSLWHMWRKKCRCYILLKCYVSLQWHVLVLCSQRCHSKCVSEATFYRLVQSFAVVLFE